MDRRENGRDAYAGASCESVMGTRHHACAHWYTMSQRQPVKRNSVKGKGFTHGHCQFVLVSTVI